MYSVKNYDPSSKFGNKVTDQTVFNRLKEVTVFDCIFLLDIYNDSNNNESEGGQIDCLGVLVEDTENITIRVTRRAKVSHMIRFSI